jgi:hypothetical protein
MPVCALLIAQPSGQTILPVFGWSLVLICLLVGGFFAITKLRQWMREDDAPVSPIGFTLSDLRQLHKQGQMTDEEFERAKSKILGSAKAMTSKMPDPLARDRGGGGKPQPPPAAPPGPPIERP